MAHRFLLALLLACFVLLAACKRDRDVVAEARSAVEAIDRPRREALATAPTKAAPREDLGRCAVSFEAGTRTAIRRGADAGPDAPWYVPPFDAKRSPSAPEAFPDEVLAQMRLGMAAASEVAEKPGPRHFVVAQEARGKLTDVGRRHLAVASDPEGANDVELVIDEESVAPAKLKGRFYVYDYGKRAVACAANVDVSVAEPPAEEKAVRSELRHAALVQQKERLFVAGPPR